MWCWKGIFNVARFMRVCGRNAFFLSSEHKIAQTALRLLFKEEQEASKSE